MLNPPLSITGYGMASSLGGAVTACAAERSGIARPRIVPYEVEDRASLEMVPVMGHTAGDLTVGFAEVGLMVRLATLALADLLSRTPLVAADIENTAVLINLPSGFYFERADEITAATAKSTGRAPMLPEVGKSGSLAETFEATKPLYFESLIDKIFRGLGLRSPRRDRQHIIFADQAGMGQVVAAAHQLLAAKAVSNCIVGGIDSLAEPRWLRACNDLGVLKTAMRPVGFMPGEGAGFLLLERHPTTESRRPAVAFLHACASAKENDHRFSSKPAVGRALTDVMRRCLGAQPDVSIIADLNGDPPRATDFGAALVQMRQELQPKATRLPAIAFGDTRAASGFIGSCVAIRAFQRGYAPARNTLVTSSSDDGGRAAVLLSTAN